MSGRRYAYDMNVWPCENESPIVSYRMIDNYLRNIWINYSRSERMVEWMNEWSNYIIVNIFHIELIAKSVYLAYNILHPVYLKLIINY